MRICFLGEGSSVHLQKVANAFSKRGHEVHVVTGKLDNRCKRFDEAVQVHQVGAVLPRPDLLHGPLAIAIWAVILPAWAVHVKWLLRRIKPDVLNCHQITVWGYLAAYSHYRPFVLTPWGSDVFRDPHRNPLFRSLTTSVLRRADFIVCDSESMSRAVVGLGADPSKIRAIGLGVDTQIFSPSKRSTNLARELGGADSLLVISIRHLKPVYNVEMLIRAAPYVLQRVPSALFVIGGDGEQREHLRKLATSLGVARRIRWLGRIPHDQMASYLASCDIYVSTSLSDSTSISLQEAMACGIPAVVTDVPANTEWISNGQNGFVVPRSRFDTLAERITELLESERQRNEFGHRSRTKIEKRSEGSREMSKLESLFKVAVTEMPASVHAS